MTQPAGSTSGRASVLEPDSRKISEDGSASLQPDTLDNCWFLFPCQGRPRAWASSRMEWLIGQTKNAGQKGPAFFLTLQKVRCASNAPCGNYRPALIDSRISLSFSKTPGLSLQQLPLLTLF